MPAGIQAVLSIGWSAVNTWIVPAVAWFGMDLDWSYAGLPGAVLEGPARLAALTSVMTAIGIGWGITWFTYAADYSRFVSRSVPRTKLYIASAAGHFIPVVWLGLLGASLATTNGSVDPGQLIVENFGSLAIPVLMLVVHGPIATNILNIYTFSVATQALDTSIGRRKLSTVVGVFSMLVVVVLIFQDDFASVLDTWLVTLVAWVSTWAGIMLVHFYRIERKRSDFAVLLDAVGTKRLPVVNSAGYVAFFVGMFMTWLFTYGSAPAAQGPIATAMGGVDMSWLVGLLTSAAVYSVLGPRVCNRHDGYGAIDLDSRVTPCA